MVPRGGVPRPPANPNNGCCSLSARGIDLTGRQQSARRTSSESCSGHAGRLLKRRSVGSQVRIARSRAGAAATVATGKRPQSVNQWATLRPVGHTLTRPADWTRTWASNTVPPQPEPTAREVREARQAPRVRPQSAPAGTRTVTDAQDRLASASREYQQWGKQLHCLAVSHEALGVCAHQLPAPRRNAATLAPFSRKRCICTLGSA